MRFDPVKIAEVATLITLLVLVAWGLSSTVAEIRPFWIDEWRIIYNLKFKTPAELWGPLAYMQQFPRVYLSLLQSFTAHYGFGYLSLRLPSFLVGTATVIAIYKLATRLYPAAHHNRFLLVMMLLSCSTFTEYYVEVKQYTMDLFLCVVAMHQLLQLLAYGRGVKVDLWGYFFLCIGFLVAPFFSYTYPIAVAPVFLVVLLQDVHMWRNDNIPHKLRTILLQWLPLFLCTFSVTVFYLTDAIHLGEDKDMQQFWAHLKMDGFEPGKFAYSIFNLFAEVGSGFLFWWLFGIIGVAALAWGLYTSTRYLLHRIYTTDALVLLYSLLLLELTFALYIAGKLPLGEPRFSAFTIPAISVLVILLLDTLNIRWGYRRTSLTISFLLLAGLIGNIFTTIDAAFRDEKYARRMTIYNNTQAALTTARKMKLPILITPGVAYPYNGTRNLPYDNTVPGDWVLTTFPAYVRGESQPVYAIGDTADLATYLRQLPEGTHAVMVGDGIHYRIADVVDK